MTLNRNPMNYFAEVEQAAFSPGNFVPGVASSPDKMLQGRVFGYHDAQRHRLGPNFAQIPINAPKACVKNYQRDGVMSVTDNGENAPIYYPNSMSGPAPQCDRTTPPDVRMSGTVARHQPTVEAVDFEQAGILYDRVLDDGAKKRLCDNICSSLGQTHKRIQYRETALFHLANAAWGDEIAKRLNLDAHQVHALSALSQEDRAAATMTENIRVPAMA
jgi:catalase